MYEFVDYGVYGIILDHSREYSACFQGDDLERLREEIETCVTEGQVQAVLANYEDILSDA